MKKSRKYTVLICLIMATVMLFSGCGNEKTKITQTETVQTQNSADETNGGVSDGNEPDSKTGEDENAPFDTTTSHDGKLKIHFIDVGQGDSIFVELPNGKTMLIDAGPSASVAANYVKAKGYGRIDYIVATHPDADHITGMPDVLNNFAVGTFYMPEKEHTTKIFDEMLNAVASNGCSAQYAVFGKKIEDTNDLKVYFVSPVKSYSDNNACSAVVKIEYKEVSALFTGDADYTAESDMLASGADLNADILKVGHHGSKTSTSDAFLKAVSPKDAIISVGAGNKYSHPTNEVLSALGSANINVYRTDEVGTIVVESDGVSYTIDKNKSQIKPNAPPSANGTTTSSNSGGVEKGNVSAAGAAQAKNSQNSQNAQSSQSGQSAKKSQDAQNLQNGQSGQSVQNNSAVVYRTKTGSKYHRAGCSYLKSSIQTTVSQAKSMGLTPCSRCKPPQ